MPLPEPILDDLRFQKDLVDEARRRIIRYCPEWTDYNISDPGITLIELFAWMTELITYRLNLVPEKNYMRFLDLLGTRLQPAATARVELTFRLSVPFPITPEDETVAVIPQGTQVATRISGEEEEVIFTTDEKLTVVPPRLTQVRREDDFNKNFMPRLGLEPFLCFSRKPEIGDTFYLGFDETNNISGHILQIFFDCEETQATGVRRNDPPWVWECAMGDGTWRELPLSTLPSERDTTGGLNNERGSLIMYLPIWMRPDVVHGRPAYWIRCRVEQRRKEQGMYRESPRVLSIRPYSLGAACTATHAVVERDEPLGTTNGDPAQVFHLPHAPVLDPREGETLEIEEIREGVPVFVPWQRVADFSSSDRHDRHFTLDLLDGEICLGPAIRQPDGSVRQYGRVPQAGRNVRFTQYRYGGGIAGNVPAGRIQVLKTALAYIDRVSNLIRADGGRDGETLAEAKMRVRREMRAQQRAVTAEDYESLAKNTSREIARVKCLTPSNSVALAGVSKLPPGMVELLVVPAAENSLKVGDLSKLYVDPGLMRMIDNYLEPYRMLTSTLRVREPEYVGVKVCVEIVVSDYAQPDMVRAAVASTLRAWLNPLALDSGNAALADLAGPDWEGWPFGRPLFLSELYSLVQKVPGVKHVLDVKVFQRPVLPGKERPPVVDVLEDGTEEVAEPSEAAPQAVPVAERRFEIPADALLCSLDHEVTVVEI